MNDGIRLKINDLMNQLDSKQRDFDQWMDKQMENLRLMKTQQLQLKNEHENQTNQMNQEKIDIKKNTEIAEADKQKYISKEKEIQAQQSQLMKEIDEIPKDFDYYKSQIYLLEMRAARLTNANIQQNEEMKKIKTALDAYEALFGVSIEIGKGTTTFNFSNPKCKVTISEMSNQYQFIEIPKELSLYQRSIMEEFNSDKNLFNFISSIRSHIC